MPLNLFHIFTGPRLFKIYAESPPQGLPYVPNHLEKCGDNIIKTISVAWSVTAYASPILILYLTKHGFCCMEGFVCLAKFVGAVGLLLLGSFFIRGVGRFAHPHYTNFLITLERAQENFTPENKALLAAYDFEFQSWPVEYNFSTHVRQRRIAPVPRTSTSRRNTLVENVKALPCRLLSFIAVHTIGKRMIYPGTVGLLQMLTSNMAIEGRSKLVRKYKGQRFKLRTAEGNEVDSMFIDRRKSPQYSCGEILVICCEGNAGYYEYGIMFTPLEQSYSVFGWNHAGFGGSTGTPFPEQEKSSIDTVMQFAINQLGFPVEKIVLFAWSIGGYTASYAAMMYPDVKGLIVDATFDDILPLAVARMPVSWRPLIVRTIRDYFNLVIVDHVTNYSGPVLVYRRTSDEVISTDDRAPLRSNRGNDLLLKVLQHRYPNLFSSDSIQVVKEWLYADKQQRAMILSARNVEELSCEMVISSYLNEHSASLPMMIGEDMATELKEELALYMVTKHLEDFDATHCTPLPSNLFRLPWNPLELQYVNKE